MFGKGKQCGKRCHCTIVSIPPAASEVTSGMQTTTVQLVMAEARSRVAPEIDSLQTTTGDRGTACAPRPFPLACCVTHTYVHWHTIIGSDQGKG